MTETVSKQRIRVPTPTTAGVFISVETDRLPALRAILDANNIRYWVNEYLLTMNGGPELAQVVFPRGSDAPIVQRLLDSLP